MTHINSKMVPPEWPDGAPGPCTVAIVGEAPGADEALTGRPFTGSSGRLINRVLADVGIDRKRCLVTNVFKTKPMDNDVKHFFIKKGAAKKAGATGDLPPFGTVGYVNPLFRQHLDWLWREIEAANPNVVVALGATAMWALTGIDKIGINRGTVLETDWPGQPRIYKVVATYHPAAILRGYSNLPLMAADLNKAAREAASPAVHRKLREIWIEPTLADIREFDARYMADVRRGHTPLAVDVETGGRLEQITCVGLSPSPTQSLVIPFYDSRAANGSYWSTAGMEDTAWQYVVDLLEDPTIIKLFQNVSYDASWFYKYGTKVRGPVEDTMHMHHALQPELPKGLAILGSMYADEMVWKTLVKHKENKRDS